MHARRVRPETGPIDRRRLAAAGLSAVLPGLGQRSTGGPRLAAVFLVPSLVILVLLGTSSCSRPSRHAAGGHGRQSPPVLAALLTLNLSCSSSGGCSPSGRRSWTRVDRDPRVGSVSSGSRHRPARRRAARAVYDTGRRSATRSPGSSGRPAVSGRRARPKPIDRARRGRAAQRPAARASTAARPGRRRLPTR